MEIKKLFYTGVVQEIKGESILINTISDEPIECLINDPVLRESLLLKRVSVTVEVVEANCDSLDKDIKETKGNMSKARDIISLDSLHRSLVSKNLVTPETDKEVNGYLFKTFRHWRKLHDTYKVYRLSSSIQHSFTAVINYAIDTNFKRKD